MANILIMYKKGIHTFQQRLRYARR